MSNFKIQFIDVPKPIDVLLYILSFFTFSCMSWQGEASFAWDILIFLFFGCPQVLSRMKYERLNTTLLDRKASIKLHNNKIANAVARVHKSSSSGRILKWKIFWVVPPPLVIHFLHFLLFFFVFFIFVICVNGSLTYHIFIFYLSCPDTTLHIPLH